MACFFIGLEGMLKRVGDLLHEGLVAGEIKAEGVYVCLGIIPGEVETVFVGFGQVTGDDVGVEGGVGIAEEAVINAICAGDFQQGVADAGHIGEELGTLGGGKAIERGDGGNGAQDAVAA